MLVATGRIPYTKGLGLENVGVKVGARGMVEIERRSSQLEDVLKHESDAYRARCEALMGQLDNAHLTITSLQEKMAGWVGSLSMR